MGLTNSYSRSRVLSTACLPRSSRARYFFIIVDSCEDTSISDCFDQPKRYCGVTFKAVANKKTFDNGISTKPDSILFIDERDLYPVNFANSS